MNPLAPLLTVAAFALLAVSACSSTGVSLEPSTDPQPCGVAGCGADAGKGCTVTHDFGAAETCRIQSAKAGSPLTIDLRGPSICGCAPSPTACEVSVQGRQIALSLAGEICPDSKTDGRACPAVCFKPTLICNIPALAVGNYEVTFPNGNSGSPTGSTSLVVTANGSLTSCKIEDGPHPVPIDGYSKACDTEQDCVAVPTGDVCSCGGGCPSAAIAKTEAERFQAARDQASGSCAITGELVGCGGMCAQARVACGSDKQCTVIR